MDSTEKRLLIDEWIISNCESLQTMPLDDPVIETVFDFLNEPDNDIELLKSITKKLYEIYQTGDEKLRLMTLCFVPSSIAIYIRVAHNYYSFPKAEFHSLTILLLAVYNCEIIQQSPESVDSGRLKTIDIRVISLAKPSIYHEANSADENNESKISIFGPYEEAEQLTMENYLSICMVLFKVYNQNISLMGTCSHKAMCHYFDKLLRQGTNTAMDNEKMDFKKRIQDYLHDSASLPSIILPRNGIQIQLDSQLMVELTRAIYYCIYNRLTEPALKMLKLIVNRSTEKLYIDVLLMVNAIKNSLAINRNRSIEDTSVTMSESQSSTERKTALTIASFTMSKLSDDISIVSGHATPTSGHHDFAQLRMQDGKVYYSVNGAKLTN